LLVWGNLGRDIKKFYKVDDYILIEGYSSIRSKTILTANSDNLKQVFITVIKVYPILLNTDRTNMKI
jgi:molybdopterin-guanine dinucleotide biosynthesis protein